MARFFCMGMLVSLLGASAIAQTPAPPAPPTGVTTIIDQDKRGTTPAPETERSARTQPGARPPPMNIRIQGDGIKLPACAAESREGEACKK